MLASGLAGCLSLSGFRGPTGDSRGSRRSPGASVHSHGDDEGGFFGVMGMLVVIWKANDVCRKTTKWIIAWWHEKRLQLQ